MNKKVLTLMPILLIATTALACGTTKPGDGKNCWDVSGKWVMSAVGTYKHDYTLTMTVNNGVITGTGAYPAGGPYSIYETITGNLVGTTVNLHIAYCTDATCTSLTGYSADAALTIQPDGSLVGTFTDSNGFTGSFVSTSGKAFQVDCKPKPVIPVCWNAAGTYGINVTVNGDPNTYQETLILTQSKTTITGVSIALLDGSSPWTIDSGSVAGSTITLQGYYNSNPSMRMQMTGTIATDGSMSGTWNDVGGLGRTGTWATTSGTAADCKFGRGHEYFWHWYNQFGQHGHRWW